MVTEILVVEEWELKGSVGRLHRVRTTAERGVCLFQAAHRPPDLTEPPQGYSKSEQDLGRLVRSRGVRERGARLLLHSLVQGLHTGLDGGGEGLGRIVRVHGLAFPDRSYSLPTITWAR